MYTLCHFHLVIEVSFPRNLKSKQPHISPLVLGRSKETIRDRGVRMEAKTQYIFHFVNGISVYTHVRNLRLVQTQTFTDGEELFFL
mmetsp:Transcript_35648/g.35866  ORF Transcript_35648/g.35866 Transcript_35648/m.35866 type:complete len:86 (-) Transcript_35648:1319-1576(-)